MSKQEESRAFMALVEKDPDSTMTALRVPFDPKEVFGKARAPVTVRVRDHSYRSTICNMGDGPFVPLRRSNREAAGVEAGQRVRVTLTLDLGVRKVEPPADLAGALRAARLLKAWGSLSYTCQREHAQAIEGAKKTETRARRIEACLEMVRGRAGKA